MDRYAVSLRAERARKFNCAKHSLSLDYIKKHNYD